MSFYETTYVNKLINNYLPAVFKENKAGWYIEYYCENPQTGKLQRRTTRMNMVANRFRTKKEARIYINSLISNINIKLSKGWNPFFESEDARLYTNINDVLKIFINEKEKELRENTLRSYRSFGSIFLEWNNRNNPCTYSGMVNFSIVTRFMDYVYNERNVGQTSYNNYLKMGRAIFNWMLEKCYIKENPFNKIKPKTRQKKTRILIDADTRAKITNHLFSTNKNFLLICKLIFYSLIRPNEIRQIKIRDINLENHYIIINNEISKNHKTRFSALTPDLENSLKELNLDKYPDDYYLFAGDLTPGILMAGNARYRKEWDKLRKELKLPQEMQLYSLRDTAIFEMLKYAKIDDLTVMQHADHHSLEVTTMYANHYDKNLIKTIYENAPLF